MADENNSATIIIKKIKKGGHGHHGGAWKIAYADFVTAMMAFFIVMWIIAMSQETKEGIQRYFNDPLKYTFGSDKVFQGLFQSNRGAQLHSADKTGGVTDGNKAGGISRIHLLAKGLEENMTVFKADVYGFKVSPDRIQFAITAQSLFSPGSALMKPEAEPLLSRLASVLSNINASILIEAHTDDLPSENPEYATNWELSALRAATVVRYFVEGHYFDPSKITAMGASQYRPIADNATPEGRAKNRRVDFYVIPDPERRLEFRGTNSEPRPATRSE